jgi:hypothetical protein
MVPKKLKDVLHSSNVVRATELLRNDQDVHKAIKDGFHELKHEIVGMRMAREIAKNKPDERADTGTHPGVVGLSVGGGTEFVQYFLQLATEGDRYGREILELSIVDGGITAVIASVASWISRPNKKGRKK